MTKEGVVLPKILDHICKANDIKQVKPEEYSILASEIRHFLLQHVSRTGGHVASNLGVVELTMALHLIMDFPKDKLIWDVGHQAYTHKLLTGRKEEFSTLRQYHGMSGFPKREENDCDAFHAGHSSTAISAALGYVKARDLTGAGYKVCAVLGDGALSGGMAYEALNNAARIKSNMMIVLNDNDMSISENVGGMSKYLAKIRTNQKYIGFKDDLEEALLKMPKMGEKIIDKLRKSKDSIKRLIIPGMLFEDMGITYIGPVDGHNISQLITAFESAFTLKEAVIVHVITKKGKGYSLAEKDPSKFHGVDPFYVKSGNIRKKNQAETYTNVVSETIVELAEKNLNITAITAAMPTGTGLMKFKETYPKRFFDVGIAEEHAVTFAAGMAAGGLLPIVVVYSTFLQRAYDQILHDVCIGNLPVLFLIDRAGIVGSDGATHQGLFDLSYLNTMPNMIIMSPKNKFELIEMIGFAVTLHAPCAIRYPRGEAFLGLSDYHKPLCVGKSEVIIEESEIALLCVGSMVKTGVLVQEKLKEANKKATLINVRFVKPFDTQLINQLVQNHSLIVTMEENVKIGGFGQMVASYLMEKGYQNIKHLCIALPDQFIEHGKVEELKKQYGLDELTITQRILEMSDRL